MKDAIHRLVTVGIATCFYRVTLKGTSFEMVSSTGESIAYVQSTGHLFVIKNVKPSAIVIFLAEHF